MDYRFISGIKGIWWFILGTWFMDGFQWLIIGLYPIIGCFIRYLVVYYRNWGYWWFPVVDYRFISGIKGIWWFILGTWFMGGFQWLIISLYPIIGCFFGIWWFITGAGFIGGFQWLIIGLYPELRVFDGLFSELGLWVVSSG
ncbi:MAG: hypothetical protein QF618_07080 [SAR324 cluster bacterium]|nr:hypothetical protein [SAR324 cluster bacterium]